MANSTPSTRPSFQRHPDTVERSESDLSIMRIESLEDYMYSPLVGQDARVLELLPGDNDEDIGVRIRHYPLRELPSEDDPIMSLEAFQETLAQGCHVRETTERRYLFHQLDSETHRPTSTWRHPDPAFDASKYEQVSNVEKLDGEDIERIRFEALSYACGAPQEDHLYIQVEDSCQQFKLELGRISYRRCGTSDLETPVHHAQRGSMLYV